MRGLKGKVAVIAGAATGIGAATAIRLVEEGMKVVVGDINLKGAESVVAQIIAGGGEAVPVQFDMTDEVSVCNLVEVAVETFGGLDLMHANAADLSVMSRDTDAVDISLDIFDRAIAVNLRGHLLCTRYAIPEMLKRGGGAMVYTSSGMAYVPDAQHVSYGVSKAGILSLMRHVAARWGKHGIRSNAIAPGFVMTDGAMEQVPEEARAHFLQIIPSTRHGRAEDIAGAVAMLASDDGVWINGQILSIDGGITMR